MSDKIQPGDIVFAPTRVATSCGMGTIIHGGAIAKVSVVDGDTAYLCKSKEREQGDRFTKVPLENLSKELPSYAIPKDKTLEEMWNYGYRNIYGETTEDLK